MTILEPSKLGVFQEDLPDRVFEYYDQQDALGCDTETTGLSPASCRLQLIQISSRDKKVAFVQTKEGVIPTNVQKLMANQKIVKIFHNAPFDFGFLHKYAEVLFSNVCCTMTASRKLRGNMVKTAGSNHKLGTVAQEILNVQMDKTLMANGPIDWTGELSQRQLDYGAHDVLVLIPIYDHLVQTYGAARVLDVMEEFQRSQSAYYLP